MFTKRIKCSFGYRCSSNHGPLFSALYQSLHTVSWKKNIVYSVAGRNDIIRCLPKLESLRVQLSTSTPTLKPLYPTRWTVRTTAINSVLANYTLLMESLDIIQMSMQQKILAFLIPWKNLAHLLSHLIFAATEQLAITLQNQDITLQGAIMASTLAEQFVNRQKTDKAFDSFYSSVVIDSDVFYPDKDGHQKESMMVHHHILSVLQRIINIENSILKGSTTR